MFWDQIGFQSKKTLIKTISSVTIQLSISFSLFISCVEAPTYKGQTSDHFDGKVFKNRVSSSLTGSRYRMLKEWFQNESSWPEWIESKPQKLERVDKGGFAVTFINHSTFLIQVDGLNILTDPIFSPRASPFSWTGPKRVRVPGIQLSDLPVIDVILISHNHYDHLDEYTIKEIYKKQKDKPPILLAGLGNGMLFKEWGIHQSIDMDWGDSFSINKTEAYFVECRHSSGRGLLDQKGTLWGSFILKTSRGSIYIAGDTAYSPHFKDQRKTYGPMKLSLLPIGAYEPRWFMKKVHMNPSEAVQAHKDLDSELSIGKHYGTFELTFEPIDEPVTKLNEFQLENFITLGFGETRIFKN